MQSADLNAACVGQHYPQLRFPKHAVSHKYNCECNKLGSLENLFFFFYQNQIVLRLVLFFFTYYFYWYSIEVTVYWFPIRTGI